MAISVNVETKGKRDGLGFDPNHLARNFAAYTGRKNRSEDAISRMADSLLRFGQENNIVYRKGFNDEPIPVSGHTRILAGQKITNERMVGIPADDNSPGIQYSPENPFRIYGTYRKMTEQEALFHSFIENDDDTRTPLNAVDIAFFIRMAKESTGLSSAEVGAKLGKRAGWVAQHEEVLTLDHATQGKLVSGEIKLNTALAIAHVHPTDRPAVVARTKADNKGKITAPGVVKAARDIGAQVKSSARMRRSDTEWSQWLKSRIEGTPAGRTATLLFALADYRAGNIDDAGLDAAFKAGTGSAASGKAA